MRSVNKYKCEICGKFALDCKCSPIAPKCNHMIGNVRYCNKYKGIKECCRSVWDYEDKHSKKKEETDLEKLLEKADFHMKLIEKDFTMMGLLKQCLYAFNDMPNTELTNGTTTYELASKIEKLLK